MQSDLWTTLFERAQNLILKPAQTWDEIAAEGSAVPDLYKRWIIPLAAIPPIATFIGASIIGASRLGLSYHAPFGAGLSSAVVSYVLMLGAIYVYALILDALAPHFGAEKNFHAAFRVAAYFPLAFWLAGVFELLSLDALWLLFGLYSLFLLYVGLPKLMKPAAGKEGGFVLAAIVVALVLYAVISLISASLVSADGFTRGGARNLRGEAAPESVEPEWRGRTALARAEESGSVDRILDAVLGGEAVSGLVSVDALKSLAPARIGGLHQRSVNVEQADTPLQVVTLKAEYSDDDQAVSLRVVNSPVMPAMLSAFGFADKSYNRHTENGYERLYRDGSGLIIEAWDWRSKAGRYGATRGDAFIVEASGRGVSMRELERAVDRLSARQLSALPTQGAG
jgi:hypothetical protein